MSERLVAAGRRFARLATRATVANPGLWPALRPLVRRQFDSLASSWEGRRGPESLASLDASLERLDRPPRRILDLGTGTGLAARRLAERFPEAPVVGVDLSPGMVAEARRLTASDAIEFQVADAARLPFDAGAFDLVVLLNMIPFFPELARVTAPGGAVVVAFSSGPETPIYVPLQTLRDRLEPLGFERFEEVEASPATAVIAHRAG